MEYTRITNDTNGNPRFVVHYPAFLQSDENSSNFLLWAGVQYQLAGLRAKTIGGKVYRGKDFGGGFVIQSYQGTREDDVKKAFKIFEDSRTFERGHNQIYLEVVNSQPEYQQCLDAMHKGYGGLLQANRAFAEVMHVCAQVNAKKKYKASQDAIFYAACLVAVALEETVQFEIAEKKAAAAKAAAGNA